MTTGKKLAVQADFLADPAFCRSELARALEDDPYLTEKAPDLTPFLDVDSARLDGLNNADEVTGMETQLLKALADIKTVVTALRRSMKDSKLQKPGRSSMSFQGQSDHPIPQIPSHPTKFCSVCLGRQVVVRSQVVRWWCHGVVI